jgi:hypothetical protein
LPETIGGFPVDVREGSPLQRMRSSNPALYMSVAAAARPEFERPVFPYERDLSGHAVALAAAAVATLRTPAKPEVAYAPPVDSPLDPIDEQVTIICHASPDAGWPTLKDFLTRTTASLTVGMYDFTSAHVLDVVKSTLRGKKLDLVLDHPPPNKTKDQTDEETLSTLRGELRDGFAFAWALERADPKAAAWIFPNAYHIKVAVRDGSAFWLSSGNWNNSNQPDIDPIADPAGSSSIAKSSDRDWHVIVEHRDLAAFFELCSRRWQFDVQWQRPIDELTIPSSRWRPWVSA